MDTLKRSLTKTIIWRVIATLITLVVTYAFTGKLGQATTITMMIAVLLMIGYYFNERIWDRVQWGRKDHAFSTQSEKSQHVQ